MTYYKILVRGRSAHGGDMQWSLPEGDTPGEWHEVSLPLSPCHHGLHLATEIGVWLKWDADIYVAEADGEVIACDNHKVCVQRARLIRKVEAPDYWLSAQDFVKSIANVPWFQNGVADPTWRVFDTRVAAWDAARDAARVAAWGAAWDAAWGAAWVAAQDAARDAAWDAAWDAARDAKLLAACIAAWNDASEHHTQYALRRWAIWQAGYGLLCNIDGVFYVYRRPR